VIHVLDQIVLLYEEDGHVSGAFIGEEEGDGVFLSWTIMNKPGALHRALAEAIEHSRPRWSHVTFKIPDNHPRASALARVAMNRYNAKPVDCDADGVFYRFDF